MASYIFCELGFGTSNFKYLSYGTIGWLKTKDNEVRECKCLGGKSKEDTDGISMSDIVYEWKVAGIKEHQFGSFNTIPMGKIYSTKFDAEHGSATSNSSNILATNSIISVFTYLMRKYDGFSQDNIYVHGTWSNCLTIRLYAVLKDRTTSKKDTRFNVVIDEMGFHIVVPMLDYSVDGIRRYVTKNDAYSAMRPIKTYTLDDDDDDDNTPSSKKVKVTIEIEYEDMDKIKKMGTILETKMP